MTWKRDWTGVVEYNRWTEGGYTWTIEDLNPEHDELAVELMLTHFINDEIMCSRLEVSKNEDSVEGLRKFWRKCTAERTTIACYRHNNAKKELAALNICTVKTIDDPPYDLTKEPCEALRQIIGCLVYLEERVNVYETLDITRYLSGAGLLVVREFRGLKLAPKVLHAREPMCKNFGIKGTATLFSGPGAQKSAANAGFVTKLAISFAELAEAGFVYPGDQNHIVKIMVKKYD